VVVEEINMKTVLSVSLPEKVAAELEAIAKETGRNKSDIVKESLGLFSVGDEIPQSEDETVCQGGGCRCRFRRRCLEGGIVKAVFDTNVIIAAFLTEGICARLLTRARRRAFDLILSD
jgi:hypothetical protein